MTSVDEEEQDEQRRLREAFLDITLHVLREIKQDQLADSLKNSKNLFVTVDQTSCIIHPDPSLHVHNPITGSNHNQIWHIYMHFRNVIVEKPGFTDRIS